MERCKRTEEEKQKCITQHGGNISCPLQIEHANEFWTHLALVCNKKELNPEEKKEYNTYPFSSPISKFLDWENGVVDGSRED